MNNQENNQITRKDYIILGIITGVFIIILIILICINAVQGTERQVVEPVNSHQDPASASEEDLSSQRNKIHEVIRRQYGSRLDGYQIADGELLEDGSWYVTTIQIPLESQWSLAQDKYRIILHQENRTWRIVAEPKLIFSYDDYPDIPKNVIYSANDL